MTDNDGGPAFPHEAQGISTQGGMTLRDYFAAVALTGLRTGGMSDELAAYSAYRIADAMLKAREGKA